MTKVFLRILLFISYHFLYYCMEYALCHFAMLRVSVVLILVLLEVSCSSHSKLQRLEKNSFKILANSLQPSRFGGFPQSLQQSQTFSDGHVMKVPPNFGRGVERNMSMGSFQRRRIRPKSNLSFKND